MNTNRAPTRAQDRSTAQPARAPRSDGQQSHVAHVAGTHVAWSERGTGEALVLLHGIGDSQRTWRRVAPALALHYRVLMPDLPGHGLSGRPDAPYTLPWFAGVIADWMTGLGVPRAHVVGHSFGGGVAQWLLLDHRSRVDRLALIAAGGLGREVGFGLRLAAIPFPERLVTPASMWLGTMLGLLLSRRTVGSPTLAEVSTLARQNGLRGTGRAFCRTIRGVIDVFGQYMQTRPSVGALGSLPPIALFWGEADRIIPVGHGRLALEWLRGATLEVFPGCGHFPHLEEPERLAEGVLAFLKDRPRSLVRFDTPHRASPAFHDDQAPARRSA
jgi:pimeloyl-ACP methyl ester carboxylesterase